jgi:hypothetical protein
MQNPYRPPAARALWLPALQPVNELFSPFGSRGQNRRSQFMNPNIVTLLFLSVLIAGSVAVLALISGWNPIGAFLIYSIGGSTTLLLLAFVSTLRRDMPPEDQTG